MTKVSTHWFDQLSKTKLELSMDTNASITKLILYERLCINYYIICIIINMILFRVHQHKHKTCVRRRAPSTSIYYVPRTGEAMAARQQGHMPDRRCREACHQRAAGRGLLHASVHPRGPGDAIHVCRLRESVLGPCLLPKNFTK